MTLGENVSGLRVRYKGDERESALTLLGVASEMRLASFGQLFTYAEEDHMSKGRELEARTLYGPAMAEH